MATNPVAVVFNIPELLALVFEKVGDDYNGILRQVCHQWKNSINSMPNPLKCNQVILSSISLVKWSKNNGCPWGARTCANAAQNGHLETLKWLRDTADGKEPCPWDEWVCAYAAQNGHLETLKWLRDNGCPE